MNRPHWSVLALGALLIVAILVHAATQRYQTTQVGRYITTTDRLTGHTTLCRVTVEAALDCSPRASAASVAP